jgi:cell division protein FtsA
MKKKITAIDVGSTKVCTITGTLDTASGLRVLGVGMVPSHGIEKGLVANASLARESIRQSIVKAELMVGYRLNSAYIGVTGQPMSSENIKGNIAITHPDQLVRQEDMKRVLDVAMNAKTPADRKVLHVIPRAYTLDGQEVENPVGMHGYELSVEAHVITGAAASIQNLTQCVSNVGIAVEDFILEPLASAEAVLTEQEKQSGVMVADIGGGITNIAIIKDGSIYHTSVLPVAGRQITQDVATGLALPFELAEEMKKKYGNLQLLNEKEDAQTLSEGGHSISYRDLCEIISARVEEIIRMIMLEVPRSNYEKLIPSGIVLTGGCANLPGITEMTQNITRLPVRIGVPSTLNGVSSAVLTNPACATSVGLILWKMKSENADSQKETQNKSTGIRGFFSAPVKLFR